MRAFTRLPMVTVEIDGVSLPDEETRALGTIRVRQELSVPTLCELTFVDPPGPLTASWRATVGAPLTILVGMDRSLLFTGEITAISHEHSPSHEARVQLRAYDPLHRLKKRQSVRSFVEATVEEVVAELTGDLGASVSASETGPEHRFFVQHDRSDLQLIVELAARSGLYLYLHDDEIRLLTLDGSGDDVPLKLGDSLLEAVVEVNSDRACGKVTAHGWDPSLIEEHSGESGDPRVGRDVTAQATADMVGGTGERTLTGTGVSADEHLEALAQGLLDARHASEVVVEGTAEGDPRIMPGAPVDVRGVATEFEGRYVVCRTEHLIDHVEGYVTRFSSEPPAISQPEPVALITFGIVEHLDDPEELARVKVSLPAYGGVLSDWMPVLFMGAGSGKGFIALPEIGDRVLVVAPDGDPGTGVVLGSLYGTTAPHDSGIQDGAVRRYTLRTSTGLQIQLDDEGRALKLQDPTGNKLELTPELFSLTSAVDFHIDAPGKAIVIAAKTVDFKKA